MPGAIIEYLRRRATSTVLVAYTIFWAIWHWRAIYATIFVDQAYIYERCGMFKSEYIGQFVGLHWGMDQIWMDLLGFVVPMILAVGYVCVLPKLTNLCYKRELHFKNERRLMKIKAEAELAGAEQEGAQKKTKQVEAEIKLKKKEAEAKKLSPEEAWIVEFKALIDNNKGREALNELKKVIYKYDGGIVWDNERQMSVDSQMICDTHGLMEYKESDDGFGGRYDLTEKGRFFMRQLTDVVAEESGEVIDLSEIPF